MKHAVKSITEQICTPSLKIATYVLAVMLASTAGGSSLVVTDTGATYTPDSGSAVVFSDGKLTQDVEVSSATFESGATLDLNGYNFLLNGALTVNGSGTATATVTNTGDETKDAVFTCTGNLEYQFQRLKFDGKVRLTVSGVVKDHSTGQTGFQNVRNSHTGGTILDGYRDNNSTSSKFPRFNTGDAFGSGPLTLKNGTHIHLVGGTITPAWSELRVEGKAICYFHNDQALTLSSSNNKLVISEDATLSFNGNRAVNIWEWDTTQVAGTIQAAGSERIYLNAKGFPYGTLDIAEGHQVRFSLDRVETPIYINRLTGAGTLLHVKTQADKNNGVADHQPVSIGGGDFSGNIAHDSNGGDWELVKVGDGMLTLTGSNSFTGDATISGGTLKLASGASVSASKVVFDGGMLAFADDMQTTMSSAFIATNAALNVEVAGDAVVTYTGSVANITNAIVKTGEGTLRLEHAISQDSDPLRQSSLTHEIHGILEMQMPSDQNTPTFKASLVGDGTLRLTGGYNGKGYRFNHSEDVLSAFTGTIDWNYANNASSPAFGLVGSPRSWTNLRFSITGEPESETIVCHSEWSSMTFGAFDIMNANAQLKVKNAATLTIGESGMDSTFNGVFSNAKMTVVKNGTGKLTIGSGFAAVEGSSISVNSGTLEWNRSSATIDGVSLTIASGVKLAGAGVFGDVDLSVNDVVAPALTAETDKTTEFMLLTATSITGTSATMTALLETVNDGDAHGKWKLVKKANGDGTVTLKCVYGKNAFVIILR